VLPDGIEKEVSYTGFAAETPDSREFQIEDFRVQIGRVPIYAFSIVPTGVQGTWV